MLLFFATFVSTLSNFEAGVPGLELYTKEYELINFTFSINFSV